MCINIKSKKILRVLFTLATIFAFLFSACTAITKESNGINGESSVNTSEVPKIDVAVPVSRLEEILDGKKYLGKLTMRFFNVDVNGNSGDSMLVQTPDGLTILIDAGLKGNGGQIIDAIKRLGVKKIDYAIATHMHQDHIGGFPEIINSIPVEKILMSNFKNYNSSYAKSFLNSIEQKNINVQYIKEGDTINIGKEIKIDILNPQPSEGVIDESDAQNMLNNESVTFTMTYKSKKFLFAADIQTITELRIADKYKDNLKADMIKVPHHGSTTSSIRSFVQAVSPKISIITFNALESLDVYNKYKQAGSKVYVTGMDGIILLVSDGEKIDVVTEKERKGNLKP
jgi:competence protein ComEC